MAGTEEPGDGQTQRLWPVGHNTKDRGCLQHAVPNRLSDTTATRGEDYEVHSSTLPNGNVPVPHPSSRWGTEGNLLHNERWISHKTSGSASNRSQEGASRLRTMVAIQVAPLQRRTNEVLQVPEVRTPQGHMSQPRVFCSLQQQTPDQCLHQETQGGTKHNGALCQLQRKPSCVESQMPRTSEADPDRTTPGHNPAKKRKGSYTKEADNLRNCPLNLRIDKNCLFRGNAKRSPEVNTNSKAPKGEEAIKGKKTYQDCGAAIKPCCQGKFLQGEERPGTSRQVDGEGKA